MSNGDIVRQLESATPDLHGGPISEPAFCLVSPTESTARYFAPSSVLILIDRVLWPPMIGSFAALNAAHSSAAMTTRPIAPITVGLRPLNDWPRSARRVFIGVFIGRPVCSAISHTSAAAR